MSQTLNTQVAIKNVWVACIAPSQLYDIAPFLNHESIY